MSGCRGHEVRSADSQWRKQMSGASARVPALTAVAPVYTAVLHSQIVADIWVERPGVTLSCPPVATTTGPGDSVPS